MGRLLLGVFFLVAGSLHFLRPKPYLAIVPDALPRKREIVYVSGVAELVGGAGVLAGRRAAGCWLIATPEGLTVVRPQGGPVKVGGKLIRASLSHLSNLPPNVSFEGVDMTFEPGPGARPFSLSAAERVEVHLRQAPAAVGDEGGVWLSVTKGRAQLAGLLIEERGLGLPGGLDLRGRLGLRRSLLLHGRRGLRRFSRGLRRFSGRLGRFRLCGFGLIHLLG